MEVFSLEEKTYDGMFLTQTPRIQQGTSQNNSILGVSSDFQLPCRSLLANPNFHIGEYSDISDAEDFDIPSSPMQQEEPM